MASDPKESAAGTPPEEAGLDLEESSDAKLSRKREREASIEPGTPGVRASVLIASKYRAVHAFSELSLQVASTTFSGDHRDRGAPAKKKTMLESTAEEDSSPGDDESPRLSTSPPDGSGLTDVRKGVKDLTTKDGDASHALEETEEEILEVSGEDPSPSRLPISPNDATTFPSIDAMAGLKDHETFPPPPPTRTPSPVPSLKLETEEPPTSHKRSSPSSSSPEDNGESDSVPLLLSSESKRNSLQGVKRKSRESSTTGVPGVPAPDPKRQKDGPDERPRTPEAPKSPRTKTRSSPPTKACTASSPKSPSPGLVGSIPRSGTAFGSYAKPTSMLGATASPPKEDEGKSEKPHSSEKSSFNDILAEKGVDTEEPAETKPAIEEVDLHTGEEDEETLQQTRAKLYTMDARDTYKERGTGTLKVNVRKSDGRGARIIMRAEGVFRLLLNASLFAGMPCAIGQDPKFIKLSILEDGRFVHHAIKVGNPKIAQDLVDTILANLPVHATLSEKSEEDVTEEEEESTV
ncbi:uncharacterized protein EI90DRAFT_3130031 [Cantharellus anzutake]|uniref:uncharacterized protein n=1 Tax=Cantharellus anzutake TaxID=1750568 RepID=UPI001908763F|nr:uncharacterized protein EI90DRAFT_3130031 [Cantharellus anzutake]KAF8324335.1 hypothetical protein EI90DRAFT_3130031 [Cantharellus anzutake]